MPSHVSNECLAEYIFYPYDYYNITMSYLSFSGMVRLVSREGFSLAGEIRETFSFLPPDVSIRCKDQASIGTHRLLLASASPSFLKSVLLSVEDEVPVIHLPEYKAEEVQPVVSLLYTGELTFRDIVTLDACQEVLLDLGFTISVSYDYEENLYKLIQSSSRGGIKQEKETHECDSCQFATQDYNAFTHHINFCRPRTSVKVEDEGGTASNSNPISSLVTSDNHVHLNSSKFSDLKSWKRDPKCDVKLSKLDHELSRDSTSHSSKEADVSQCPSKQLVLIQSDKRESSTKKLKRQSSEAYSCHHCSRVFSKSQSLAGHVKSAHPEVRHPRNQICESCGRSFSKKSALLAHECGESRTIPCPDCGKVILVSSLKAHRQYHAGGKVTCPLCKVVFASRSSLERHKRLHSNKGERFLCGVCQKAFSQKSALNTHSRVHTGERLLCPVCEKRFISQSLLNHHYRTTNCTPKLQ